MIPLIPGATIQECIDAGVERKYEKIKGVKHNEMANASFEELKTDFESNAAIYLTLLTYLCCDNADTVVKKSAKKRTIVKVNEYSVGLNAGLMFPRMEERPQEIDYQAQTRVCWTLHDGIPQWSSLPYPKTEDK